MRDEAKLVIAIILFCLAAIGLHYAFEEDVKYQEQYEATFEENP